MEDIILCYKFVPDFINLLTSTIQNNSKNITKMKKKIYTAPALSVEEFEMSDIVCSSPVKHITTGDDVNLNYGGGSSDPARGKSRNGIWDED